MNFTSRRRPDPVLDITPMIDVVFQLVLFFMVSTTFVDSPGFQVDLPRSSAQTLVASDDDVDIWITCGKKLEGGACLEGQVYLDDEPVTLAELREHLKGVAEKDTGTVVIVRADQGVTHGSVVEVMDMAHALELTHLAIATELPKGSGGSPDDQ